MLTRVNPTLDRALILFQDVIDVLHRSVFAVLLQNIVSEVDSSLERTEWSAAHNKGDLLNPQPLCN